MGLTVLQFESISMFSMHAFLTSQRSRRYSRTQENGQLEIAPAQKLHILNSAHRTHGSAHLNVFVKLFHVLHQCKYAILTFHNFGSLNVMKTKIPRSIQCNNMPSFIAIEYVLIHSRCNIIAIYEL
jgi:hypothetical protein